MIRILGTALFAWFDRSRNLPYTGTEIKRNRVKRMLGTLVNVGTIVTGSLVGAALRRGFGEKYKSALNDAMGLSATCMGINTVVHALPESQYHVLFIVSLAIGITIGTRLDLAGKFDRAVSGMSGGSNLARGLSTAILLFCIGTFSILGPMRSALLGDNSYLYTNAVLDGISSIVLGSTFGAGIALAAVALFFWQGSIYLLAHLIQPFVTDALLTELSLIGGAMILSSGLSILKIKEFKTLNLLPALLVPPVAVTILSALEI